MTYLVSTFTLFAMSVFMFVCVYVAWVVAENAIYKKYYRSLLSEISEMRIQINDIYIGPPGDTYYVPVDDIDWFLNKLHNRRFVNWERVKYEHCGGARTPLNDF